MTWQGSAEWKVRRALREATGAVHERLHEAPPFAAIAEERLSLGGYTDLLRKIAAFHFTVAPDLELDEDRRELLSRDLGTLGAAAAGRIDWSAPQSPAARLGCSYVVEGSSLGGKVIYRQLDYLFGESAGGRRFFRGTPSDGARWRSLCQRLEGEGREPGALDEMIAGAQRAFALFEQLVAPAHAHG